MNRAPARPGLPARWRDCRRGGVAVIFAMALPAMAVVAVGAAELHLVYSGKAHLQEIADNTVLNAAAEMSFSAPAAVLARAEAYALSQARQTSFEDLTAAAAMGEDHSLTVTLTAHRDSFFGNILPPGGFNITVSATAANLSRMPLCVLGKTATVKESVNVNRGVVTATGCMVHSNSDVKIGSGSTLDAGILQASGLVIGGGGGAQTGAPQIPDPFATLNTAPGSWNACNLEPLEAVGLFVLELNPGVHCGHFDVRNSAVLRLRPGIHYFRNTLHLKDNARLEGNHATLVFGRYATLDIDSDEDEGDETAPNLGVRINLVGGQTGPMAGFVLVMDRARTKDFKIKSHIIQRLEGVVYSPQARFEVEGAAQAAGNSNWTVIVAKELRLNNDARVVINSDYSASSVPVPSGVGNNTANGLGPTLAR